MEVCENYYSIKLFPTYPQFPLFLCAIISIMDEREWDEHEDDFLPPEAFCPREDCGSKLETFRDDHGEGRYEIYSYCKECGTIYRH